MSNSYQSLSMRRLPVVLLLDTSGSMHDNGKIDVLNDSVEEMIEVLRLEDAGLGVIVVSIVTFGGESAEIVVKNCPIGEVQFSKLRAKGSTPMGHAFRLTQELIEDYEALPSNSFIPTLALVSDGSPKDKDWDTALDNLINCERGAKASRFALAIGSDADKDMLRKFHPGGPREAADAAGIREFLHFVTMTILDPTYLDNDSNESDNSSSDHSIQINDDF